MATSVFRPRHQQVKIRGFRVELGEIEHCLRKHPGIKDAVVVARAGNAGDRRLVAYVLPTAGPLSVRELRSHVAASLPDYMVPNFIAMVESFPLSANGKLDRKALPWPLSVPEAASPVIKGPAVDQLREEIAALFCSFLGVPNLDAEQDLWDQGASSFTMVQLSNALRGRYQQRIPVSVLVSQPTIANIALQLAKLLDSRPEPQACLSDALAKPQPAALAISPAAKE